MSCVLVQWYHHIAIYYVHIVYVVVLIFGSKFTLYDGFIEQLGFGSFLSM